MNSIKEKLSEAGLRVTPQRVLVYDAMQELGHACVDEVVSLVQKNNPAITVATVYNVLECFVRSSIITKLNTSDNKMYFDISTHPHHHLYCGETHRLEDFDNEEFLNMVGDFFKKHKINNFDLKKVEVQLIGNFKQ